MFFFNIVIVIVMQDARPLRCHLAAAGMQDFNELLSLFWRHR